MPYETIQQKPHQHWSARRVKNNQSTETINLKGHYQEFPNKRDVPGMHGEEQGGDVSLELLVLEPDLVGQVLAARDLGLADLEPHGSDEVDVDERIGGALESRSEIVGVGSLEEAVRGFRLAVYGEDLFAGEETAASAWVAEHRHFRRSKW